MAELFTRAGIPLVLGVSFREDQLDGSGYSTQRHLLVLVGFDAEGSPVLHDPASHGLRSDEAVRTTHRRDPLLEVWQHGSSSIVYVLHRPQQALPATVSVASW